MVRSVWAISRFALIGLFVAIWLVLGVLTKTRAVSWNEQSRLATVVAIVEEGTFSIDKTWERFPSGDKVMANGHLYSDKLPVLSVYLAGWYWVLVHFFGWSFTTRPDLCTFWLGWWSGGLGTALTAAAFYGAIGRWGLPANIRWASTGILAGGTLLTSYGVVINNHTPVAACVALALPILVALAEKLSLSLRQAVTLGALLGAAVTVEVPLPSFLTLMVVGGLLWGRCWRGVGGMALGSLPLLLTHFALNYAILGDLRPSYMLPNLWRVGHGLTQLTENFEPKTWGMAGSYFLQSLFGGRGLLLTTPLAMLGFGALAVSLGKGRPLWERRFAAGTGVTSLLTLFYFSLSTTSMGGIGYGIRYYVSLTPLWWYFGCRWLAERKNGGLRPAGSLPWKVIVTACVAWSMVMAWRGVSTPWVTGQVRPVPQKIELPANPAHQPPVPFKKLDRIAFPSEEPSPSRRPAEE